MMLFTAACLTLLGIGRTSLPVQAKQSKSPTSSQAVADSTNAFAFRLLGKIGTPTDKNMLISPFSVSTAMSMVGPGLVGKDQQTLLSSLAPGLSLKQLEE